MQTTSEGDRTVSIDSEITAPAIDVPPVHRLSVPEDWIDGNGHMNAAYYTVAVKDAAIIAHDLWDYGTRFRARNNESNFVYDAHVIYHRELRLDDPLRVTTRLHELDSKRMRLIFEIENEAEGYLAATVQYLVIHVHLGPPPKANDIPPDLAERLRKVQRGHARHALPPGADKLLEIPLKAVKSAQTRQGNR